MFRGSLGSSLKCVSVEKVEATCIVGWLFQGNPICWDLGSVGQEMCWHWREIYNMWKNKIISSNQGIRLQTSLLQRREPGSNSNSCVWISPTSRGPIWLGGKPISGYMYHHLCNIFIRMSGPFRTSSWNDGQSVLCSQTKPLPCLLITLKLFWFFGTWNSVERCMMSIKDHKWFERKCDIKWDFESLLIFGVSTSLRCFHFQIEHLRLSFVMLYCHICVRVCGSDFEVQHQTMTSHTIGSIS